MNAQEAIEIMEKTIENEKAFIQHSNEMLGSEVFVGESKFSKALSIVLELAKKEDKAETRLYDIAGHMMDYYQAGTLSEEHLIELIDKELTAFYNKEE